MKLSKIYSNYGDKFHPVLFVDGLNVVQADITKPENKKRNSHNLGKTLFGRLIDFCLLNKRDPDFFLFKHEELFADFVFFLELKLANGSLVTLRRSVERASKISFKKHRSADQDFSNLDNREENWDHFLVPFERAKDLLDAMLGWDAIKPWNFRKSLGYFNRTQDDYGEVFKLKRFAGAHADWKPFLAKIMGFDGVLVESHYSIERQLDEKKNYEEAIKTGLGQQTDISKVDGLIQLKEQEIARKEHRLDEFDFREQDKEKTKELVDSVDGKIAELNAQRYSLSQNKKRVEDSLARNDILFDPEEASKLYKEAGVLFEGQIKKDFSQLIEFNKAISEERKAYLQEELGDIDGELEELGSELDQFGKKRAEMLSYLSGSNALKKYKAISNELVQLRADVQVLQEQRTRLHKLQNVRSEIRKLENDLSDLEGQVTANVSRCSENPKSKFSMVRKYFNEIVESTINKKALLSVQVNRNGHLEFSAEFLDDSGNSTSAAKGNTHKKLLCIAFDLAVLKAHLGGKFPRFVFHDGVFEALEPRLRENLMHTLREYVSEGIQIIITLITSDAPKPSRTLPRVFDEKEIVLRLSDAGPNGRLFKVKSW